MSVQAVKGGLLPWHATCWDILQQARQSNRFPHALLLVGPAGVGKRLLLNRLARSLLCRHRDVTGLACGQCGDCTLFSASTHPDYVEIRPDADGKSNEIKVDAIRGLADTDGLTAHRGGWKVIVIDPAHRMNANAFNALLKTLEEPAGSTFICLISEHPSRLPATIRSRCQHLRVPVPAQPQALAWLEPRITTGDTRTLLRLAQGAPLRALDMAKEEQLSRRDQLFAGFAAVGEGTRDPVSEAAAWNKIEPTLPLEWMGGWLSDLLRLATGHPAPNLINADKASRLSLMASRVDVAGAHRFLRTVWEARSADTANLNLLLLYESLLVRWAQLTRT
jgi:DNA polymerase-3 subunit delta'